MTHNTISHEIAKEMRTEILRQRYVCGDRLPSERDLATRFDASRGAVREALSQLEQTGLIKIQPGGARVRPIQSASISVLGPLMTLDESPDPVLIDQFLQTFAALSALTAREAINYANNEEMNRLRQMVVMLGKQAKDYEAMQPQWREFLRALGEIADNLVIHLIANDLRAQFVDQMVKLGIQPELRKKAINEVLSSLKTSVTERNGDLAQSAVQQYFDELRRSVTKIFGNQRSSSREQGK
jgi:GntR family transcriptional regulator, transcriptional repressor for pyruvate dehydrogenase complex